MLKDEFDCTIFSAGPDDFQRREAAGVCPLVALPDDECRHEQFLSILDGSEIVVLDNYFFTEEYISELRHKGCKVVRIQDFFEEKSSADAIVFPCRDPRRALLRQPFFSGVKPAGKKAGRWIIAIGGTDPLGLSEHFKQEMEQRGIDAIVLGGGKNAAEVAELLRSAEGVVCSASSVCYEALACGCKVCAGWYVDNQQDFYRLLCDRGLILPLGDLRSAVLPEDPGAAPSDPEMADEMGLAPKFYRTLFKSLELEMINYTALTEARSREVWEVRNLEEIRKWMTNPDPFSFESHSRFIESLRTRKDKEYYAFYQDGKLVGSFDMVNIIENDSAETGLFVNPTVQGRGIGRQMFCRMESRAHQLGLGTLRAEVFKDNEKSLKLHLSMGYRATAGKDGMQYLTKTL